MLTRRKKDSPPVTEKRGQKPQLLHTVSALPRLLAGLRKREVKLELVVSTQSTNCCVTARLSPCCPSCLQHSSGTSSPSEGFSISGFTWKLVTVTGAALMSQVCVWGREESSRPQQHGAATSTDLCSPFCFKFWERDLTLFLKGQTFES